MWQILNDLIPTKSNYAESFIFNGIVTTDQKVISNNFNKYFTNIGINLAKRRCPLLRNTNRVHIYKVQTTRRKLTLRHSGNIYWNSLDKYITVAVYLSGQIKITYS